MRFYSVIFLASTLILSGAVTRLQGQQPAASPAKGQSASTGATSAKAPATTSTASAKSDAAQASVDGKPTPAQVRKLLELLRVRDDLQATLDSMKQQMKGEAVDAFRDKVPNPSPEQLKSVNGILDDAFAELSLDDLIQDLVPVYQRHLTRSDVQALVTFYASGPGQKILREQPAIIRESMQTAGSSQQKRMELMLAKVELRMQQLIDQQKPKTEGDKQ